MFSVTSLHEMSTEAPEC